MSIVLTIDAFSRKNITSVFVRVLPACFKNVNGIYVTLPPEMSRTDTRSQYRM